jgi:uncharacterized protein YqeY
LSFMALPNPERTIAMTLKERIVEDMKAAMKARAGQRLGALRLLLAAVRQREIDGRNELDDDGVVAVIEKLIKQRRDSASQYERAQREDLAAGERFEAEILSGYLPERLSDSAITAEVGRAIAESGATSPADIGKVMALLKARLAGKADFAIVSTIARSCLAGRNA